MLKKNLEQIGITLEIKAIPQPAYDATLNRPGEPFDIAFFVTPSVDYFDAYAFLNIYFESRFIGRTNSSNLRSPEFDRRLRAAATLGGARRLRAYAQLDADLASRCRAGCPPDVHQRADARVEAGRLRAAAARTRSRGRLLEVVAQGDWT